MDDHQRHAERLCHFCSKPLPPAKATGRPRVYHESCRKKAERLRKRRPVGEPWSPPIDAPLPGDDVEAFLVGRTDPPDEQVVAAVHETILLERTYRRLGVEARPTLAWRSAGMADAIAGALEQFFGGALDG